MSATVLAPQPYRPTQLTQNGFTTGQRVKIEAPDVPEVDGLVCTIIGFDEWGAYTLVNRGPRHYDRPGHVPKFRAAWDEMVPCEPTPTQTKPVVIPSVRAIPPKSEVTSSGNACSRCGGLMVRTGKCETCQSCGDSPGGCS